MESEFIFFTKSNRGNIENGCHGNAGHGLCRFIIEGFIEKVILKGISHPEVELLFGNLLLISASLAVVGP